MAKTRCSRSELMTKTLSNEESKKNSICAGITPEPSETAPEKPSDATVQICRDSRDPENDRVPITSRNERASGQLQQDQEFIKSTA